MDALAFTLPLPPSTNVMYRNVAGRTLKSREYRAWKETAAWQVAAAMHGAPALLHFEVRLLLPPTRRDPDNSIKPLLDALQAGGAIHDDKHLRKLVLAVDDARADRETVLIELREAEGPMASAPQKKTRGTGIPRADLQRNGEIAP